MAQPRARVFNGKKFMWDGEEYETVEQARAKAEEYEKENFEIRVVEEDGTVHVYTRREVEEVVAEGPPPV